MTSFTGKILCVDLTARTSEVKKVPPEGYEDLYRKMEEADARIAANKERLGKLKE